MINFAVIIPDRGDRPMFTKQCFRLLEKQTVKPNKIYYINYTPVSDEKDITPRYRNGYEQASGKGHDVIFFIENDDYYRPEYFETMLAAWKQNGEPELFGTNHSYYYHIKLFAYFKINHFEQSLAMCTMIKPDLVFDWGLDNNPYTDTHLWRMTNLKKKIFFSEKTICLGIKHGIGLTGGDCHKNRLERFTTGKGIKDDADKSFLKSIVDEESISFYENYFVEHGINA